MSRELNKSTDFSSKAIRRIPTIGKLSRCSERWLSHSYQYFYQEQGIQSKHSFFCCFSSSTFTSLLKSSHLRAVLWITYKSHQWLLSSSQFTVESSSSLLEILYLKTMKKDEIVSFSNSLDKLTGGVKWVLFLIVVLSNIWFIIQWGWKLTS